MHRLKHFFGWLFDSRQGASGTLIARWIFLRVLAVIYFSAFFSLLFQIKGLIGPQGILPAEEYLAAATRAFGSSRVWHAPSLFWLSSDAHTMMLVTWVGLLASVLVFANFLPRLNLFICWICFLSFVTTAGDFSNYQSDGMLLEAGFIALFFAPPGVLPGWGADHVPSRASLFLLLWEWFRIYFESGMVKILSGDEQWRTFTAMDEYYQNGPLPTWVGWYVEHLPHRIHATATFLTLVLEFGVVLMLFFPRRVRRICFFIVTPWEMMVILTANYAFLNYLVLALGFLLLDDDFVRRFVPKRFWPPRPAEEDSDATETAAWWTRLRPALRSGLHVVELALAVVFLTWIAYDTTAEMVMMVVPFRPPIAPIVALDPFRIANRYGLFAVMTRGRYEIEFQGSNDGQNWQPYLFTNKPQAVNEHPRIYAPFQPRFDWNLWFASLGDWQQNEIVPLTEERLLENDADVLSLFRSNPFPNAPPHYVRAVLWQYWFTSMDEKKRTGNWWRRQLLGLYAPVIVRTANGRFGAVQEPGLLPLHD